MVILTTLEELRISSPLGAVVHECITHFDDPTWVKRRHELLARGMAECAYWLYPWQVEELDGMTLNDFQNKVFHREAYYGVRYIYKGLRQLLTVPTPNIDLQYADEWRANPAFQEKVAHMLSLLDKSLHGFNVQLVLEWLSKGVYRTPDRLADEPETQVPTGLFDAVTSESLMEWHEAIDNLGYALGTQYSKQIADVYAEIMSDVSVSKELRGVFGISHELYGTMGVGLHRARAEDHIDFDTSDLPDKVDPNQVIQTEGGIYVRRGAV